MSHLLTPIVKGNEFSLNGSSCRGRLIEVRWLRKVLEHIARFQHFLSFAHSHNTGVRFFLPNVVSSNIKIFPGGRGYRFPLLDDLVRMPLKGRRGTFAAIFCCVPTTFGNDCSYELVLLIASITLLSHPPKGIGVMHYKMMVRRGEGFKVYWSFAACL